MPKKAMADKYKKRGNLMYTEKEQLEKILKSKSQ